MKTTFIRIGVTSGISNSGAEGNYTHLSVPTAYIRALYKAGADVVHILSPYTNKIENLINHLDGVLLTGGIDIDPVYYEKSRHEYVDFPDQVRDRFELKLTKEALANDLSVLGICRGLQLLNIEFGGTLYQDINKESPGQNIHNIKNETEVSHEVNIVKDSILGSITENYKMNVNSAHHQAIAKLGKNLKATAIASDGLIEAIESINHTWVVGVQWHPEMLAQKISFHQNIFDSFIKSIKFR